jgi:hypothetical protein
MPSGGSYTTAIAAEYLAMLRDIPARALAKAFEDFRRGVVGNPRWMPLPAEIRTVALAIAVEQNKADRARREEQQEVRAALPSVTEKRRKTLARREAIIQGYRETYKEAVKSDPSLTYVQHICNEHKRATGHDLRIPRPRADAPQKRANG